MCLNIINVDRWNESENEGKIKLVFILFQIPRKYFVKLKRVLSLYTRTIKCKLYQ